MTAMLQIVAAWLLQVAMVIGGLVFVVLCLFVVVDLLSSAVAGAMKRGDAWSKITYYFAHKRRIDGWAQELRDWEMLRSELAAAMERNAKKSNTIRSLQMNLADMILTAGDRKEACAKLQQQLDVVAVQYTSKCLELQAAVEHCADKGRRITQLCDEGSQRIVRHEEEKAKLASLLEEAWGIIANAHGGDWERADASWREAAVRWRDKWLHLTYPSTPPAAGVVDAAVKGDDCAGAGKCHGPMKWCAVCGDVSKICDHPAACDAHVETTVGPE